MDGDLQNWIEELYSDPITKILIENSNLTKIQLEIFLINILADYFAQKRLKFNEKVQIRIKGKISRGSFNRSLKQAQKNIISSIYTLLLLGYIGIFESPALIQYLEISNKLKVYMETYHETWQKRGISKEDINLIKLVQNEIEKTLREIAIPKKITNRL